MWDSLKNAFSKKSAPAAEPVQQEPTMDTQPAVWKNNRAATGTPAATSPAAAAQAAQQNPATPPAVWKNNRAATGTPAATSPQAAAAAAQTAKQAAPGQTAYNVPTGSLPAVSATMPQNMPATPPGKASATKPTYNVPTAAPATNTVMPTNMQTTASPATTPAVTTPQTAPAEPLDTQPTQTTPPSDNNPPAVEPETEQPSKAKSKGKSGPGLGSRIMQGIGDFFNPNARVANAANKTANAKRADAIKREVGDFQSMVRGFDPQDSEAYQDAFVQWAKNKYPHVDQNTLTDIASSIDPSRPASITKAIGSAYNTHMTADAQMNPMAKHLSGLRNQAQDQAMLKRFQQDIEDPQKYSKDIAAAAMKSDDLKGMLPQQQAQAPVIPQTEPSPAAQVDLEPQIGSEEEKSVLDNLKTLKGTEEKLMQKLSAIRSQAPVKQTKVTKGGPTPEEQAELEKRIQAAQALPNVTAESRNFSAILWRQMREDK